MLAPDVVAAVGLVQPQIALGNAPPMATSRMTMKPWSTTSLQYGAATWLSATLKNSRPSRYQRICSSPGRVRSTITEKVWYPVWRSLHACSPLLSPEYSLQGPPLKLGE